MNQGKAFEIPKSLVWKAYQTARKNRGAPGFDRMTITMFDEQRNKNLYKIWNRLCSGSYLPPPVLEKKIPKADGRVRTLGIPTFGDRVAQGTVKIFLEERLDKIFHQDSYGYRPGKSAHQALEVTKRRCWKYSWLLEVDIKGFFDNVRHDLVIRALQHHRMPKWVILYCKRWLQAPMITNDGNQLARTVGTPQGGVISPLLANLVLHYAFDIWMQRNHGTSPFARYADDIVCHCQTMKETARLKRSLEKRLLSLGLELHPGKTNLVYVDTFKRFNVRTKFTFLGYDFKHRVLRKHTGELFRKIMPGASNDAMKMIVKTIKNWRIHRSTKETLEDFARRYNSILRGWIKYYGKHWYRTFTHRLVVAFNSRIIKWISNKYRISYKKSLSRFEAIKVGNPKLFAPWYLLRSSNV